MKNSDTTHEKAQPHADPTEHGPMVSEGGHEEHAPEAAGGPFLYTVTVGENENGRCLRFNPPRGVQICKGPGGGQVIHMRLGGDSVVGSLTVAADADLLEQTFEHPHPGPKFELKRDPPTVFKVKKEIGIDHRPNVPPGQCVFDLTPTPNYTRAIHFDYEGLPHCDPHAHTDIHVEC